MIAPRSRVADERLAVHRAPGCGPRRATKAAAYARAATYLRSVAGADPARFAALVAPGTWHPR
jgi:hypothetical protein